MYINHNVYIHEDKTYCRCYNNWELDFILFLFTREITIHSFDVLGDIIIHNIVLRRDHHSQFFVGEII